MPIDNDAPINVLMSNSAQNILYGAEDRFFDHQVDEDQEEALQCWTGTLVAQALDFVLRAEDLDCVLTGEERAQFHMMCRNRIDEVVRKFRVSNANRLRNKETE